jgi:uncharacterized protein YndB with AHSA1/START domain
MKRGTTYGQFVIERVLPQAPARVFAAWADFEKKKRWFGDWHNVLEHTQDFRVGGRALWRGRNDDGVLHQNDTVFHDIVDNERIVNSYTMTLDERRISVSLQTLEFAPVAGGTKLTLTESGVFLDGYDGAEDRVRGTNWLLDHLEAALRGD